MCLSTFLPSTLHGGDGASKQKKKATGVHIHPKSSQPPASLFYILFILFQKKRPRIWRFEIVASGI